MPGPDWEHDGDGRRDDLFWTPRSCLLTVVAVLAIAALVVVGTYVLGRWVVDLLDASTDSDSDSLGLASLALVT